SGMHSGASDVSTGSSFVSAFQFIHYINSTDAQVVSDHGAEKMPSAKDKTPWGANKMIALQEPDPSLGNVFQEAQGAGDIKWLRWETVNGKQAAVYSFDVPKKKAHCSECLLLPRCKPSRRCLLPIGVDRRGARNGRGRRDWQFPNQHQLERLQDIGAVS